MKNKKIQYIIAALVYVGIFHVISCTPEWKEHYEIYPETVNMELWDVIKAEKRYSIFVDMMEAYELDSIFRKDVSHTLFIPENNAFASLVDTAGIMVSILENHILKTVFLTRNSGDGRRVENMNGKFPLVNQTPEGYSYDLIPITYSSPLYLDGVYYEISDVAVPRPNLLEFTKMHSSIIAQYIDQMDSVYIDFNLSTPVGFDSRGYTVYDSVFGVVNRFERDFFPVSKEFRNKSATFILFNQEQYDQALDEMADMLGPAFADHKDIPESWQFDILLPYFVNGSLFDDMLDYHQFSEVMVSVTGDTVYINPENINPESRFLCSNGYTYIYKNVTVPEELYLGDIHIEGEDLIDSIGANTYEWKSHVIITGSVASPEKQRTSLASEGALVNVNFPRGYNGEYTVEFQFKNVFPMRYRLEWRLSFRPSGLYAVYVNDQRLERKDRFGRTIFEFDTFSLRNALMSVDGVNRFIPNGNYNTVDYYVDHITDFGNVSIRFEYLGPGEAQLNGFNIDYVRLVPVLED